MKITCKLLGHKLSDTTDSGFHFCERCNAHSYYDDPVTGFSDVDNWNGDGVLFWPFRWARYHLTQLGRKASFWYRRTIQKDDLPF